LARKRGKLKGDLTDQDSNWGETGLQSARSILALFGMVVLVGVTFTGMERLKAHVYSRPEYNPQFRVELHNPPEWVTAEGWHDRILATIRLAPDRAWIDETLVADVADQINRSGWVSHVNRVTQTMDGRILVDCDYRRPIAMIQTPKGFIPVDRQGVRLPEVYTSLPDTLGWMRIAGVQSDVPEVGEPFRGADALAAVNLAYLLFEQDFSQRINAVIVTRHHGRHELKLTTRDGATIIWGSAIGEEIEEASVREKVRNVAAFFKKGSPQAQVDVSVYREGWIEPAPETAIRTVDSSKRRAR
jgi:hypothetical protein